MIYNHFFLRDTKFAPLSAKKGKIFQSKISFVNYNSETFQKKQQKTPSLTPRPSKKIILNLYMGPIFRYAQFISTI